MYKTMDESACSEQKCVFEGTFCQNNHTNKQNLVRSSTETALKLKAWATDLLNDKILMNIANEVCETGAQNGIFYHKTCWVKFSRKHDSHAKIKISDDNYQNVFGEAVDQLIAAMYSTKADQPSEPTVFKLSELTRDLQDLLDGKGYANCNLHKTRLKDILLSRIDGLQSELVGRDVILLFNSDIKHLIQYYCTHKTSNNDEVYFCKTAMKLRSEILIDNKYNFDGSLHNSFTHENTVPEETIKFLNIVMYGESSSTTSIARNLAELIKFNSKKVKRDELTVQTRNVLCREQPLPLYCGLLIHATTHKKRLVKDFAELGMSISYNRVLEIETAVANKICELYSEDSRICPPNLEFNVFTTSAIDNIDHNPSSNGAAYSFHGTGISLIQHPITASLHKPQLTLTKQDFEPKPIRLPQNYYNFEYFADESGEVPSVEMEWDSGNLKLDALKLVQDWLTSSNDNRDNITSWATFHSRRSSSDQRPVCKSNMLPLLKDSINSNSVVRHCLDIIMSSTSKINPSQTAVCNGDEPVYARIKTIQWLYPEKYGEDKLVAMLGGLHIEMSFIAVIGTWLTGSGWNEAIVSAGISTPGKTLGILKGSHVKRCRYAHEVSLAALNVLLRKAYDNDGDRNENEQFDEWIKRKRSSTPQFHYWVTTMELEALLLLLVKSIREANFADFVKTLDEICPWYFLLDHVNYARWLPIFIRDMKLLRVKHPEIFAQFMAGFFTARKTSKKFSCMAQDQFHEQNNKLLKEHKTNLALLDKEASLVKWMLSGPEIARIIEEYHNQENVADDRHHEDNASFNTTFSENVKALVTILEKHDIFATNDLTSIGNDRKVMNQFTADRVLRAEQTAKDLYNGYIKERILTTKKSIHDTIKQNRFQIFHVTEKKAASKDTIKLQQAKTYANDVCKLLLAHEIRGGDIRSFFQHENHQFPPSISEFGELRHTSAEETFVDRLEKDLPKDRSGGVVGDATCLIIDGEDLLSTFTSVKCKTFLEFSATISKYIDNLTTEYNRIDLVFGCYGEKSVQSSGPILLVDDNASFPKSLLNFMSNDFHKKQLSNYVAKKLMIKFKGSSTQIIVAADKYAFKNNDDIDVQDVSPCNHTDTASRVILHAKHSSKTHTSICIQTSKVISVVLGMYAFGSAFSGLTSENQLFIQLKSGKKERIIPIHRIYNEFPDISETLIFFYTFTGCKNVSAFHGIGKTKAFNTWMKYRDVDAAFKELTELQTPDIGESIMAIMQRFIILMYDNKSKLSLVNDFRWTHFKKSTSIEKIPPTLDALQQHIKRACFQAKMYYQCTNKEVINENQLDWGWRKNEMNLMEPLWITIPISSDLKILTSCKCADNCKKKCRCERKCTKLCDCEGSCQE